MRRDKFDNIEVPSTRNSSNFQRPWINVIYVIFNEIILQLSYAVWKECKLSDLHIFDYECNLWVCPTSPMTESKSVWRCQLLYFVIILIYSSVTTRASWTTTYLTMAPCSRMRGPSEWMYYTMSRYSTMARFHEHKTTWFWEDFELDESDSTDNNAIPLVYSPSGLETEFGWSNGESLYSRWATVRP